MAARVVVTGMGVYCSVAQDVPSLSLALREGRSGIRALEGATAGEPQVAALVQDLDLPDALAARELPDELRRAAVRAGWRSPLPVRCALLAALEAWQQAGLATAAPPADRLGLVVGGNNLTGRLAYDLLPVYGKSPVHLPGRFALHFQDTDHVATISEVLGIAGEGFTVGGASASGNLAIIHGSRLLDVDAVDACLVVGAMSDLSPMELQAFVNLGAMTSSSAVRPEEACRPFDEGRSGFVYGQGTACLVLEKERAAASRNVPVLARLAATALKLDANRLADPGEEGEAWVMATALERARLAPRDLAYVNAHGSGSLLGDAAEIAALRRVLGAAAGRPWVNATKGLLGHCLGAAGVVEAVATIAQLQGGFVHPNPCLWNPLDDTCRFAGARCEDTILHSALSNSFGFGGFNSSIVLTHD